MMLTRPPGLTRPSRTEAGPFSTSIRSTFAMLVVAKRVEMLGMLFVYYVEPLYRRGEAAHVDVERSVPGSVQAVHVGVDIADALGVQGFGEGSAVGVTLSGMSRTTPSLSAVRA